MTLSPSFGEKVQCLALKLNIAALTLESSSFRVKYQWPDEYLLNPEISASTLKCPNSESCWSRLLQSSVTE